MSTGHLKLDSVIEWTFQPRQFLPYVSVIQGAPRARERRGQYGGAASGRQRLGHQQSYLQQPRVRVRAVNVNIHERTNHQWRIRQYASKQP